MRRFRLPCVLFALSMPFFSGCLVPELDNYRADKSAGSGTITVHEDAGDSGGGTGVVSQNCQQTFYGQLTFNGPDSAPTYKGECSVQGSVFVGQAASTDQISQLRQLSSITGVLTLQLPAVGPLEFPNLRQVGGLQVDANSLVPNLFFSALQVVGVLSVAGNASLTTFDAPMLGLSDQQIIFANNASLQHIALSSTYISGLLRVNNHPNLTDLKLAGLNTVGTLEISDNPLMPAPQLSTSVGVSQWTFCHDTSIPQAWLDEFKQKHPGVPGSTCN